MLIGDVISEDESKNKKATKVFEELMKQASLLKQEYEEYKKDKGEDPDDDDDLGDFLGGLGISLS